MDGLARLKDGRGREGGREEGDKEGKGRCSVKERRKGERVKERKGEGEGGREMPD